MPTKLDHAVAHASRGWKVFPLWPNGKNPFNEHGFYEATSDIDEVTRIWTERPDLNIGLATGEASGLLVLDVDFGHDDKRGDESLDDLQATFGRLPDTVESQTARGGRHIYFTYPAETELANTANKLGVDLDTRATGGYVVAPGSTLNDGCWQWEASSSPNRQEIAPAPDWLIQLLSTPNGQDEPRTPAPRPDGDLPGDRFNSSVTWPEMMERIGGTFMGNRKDRASDTEYSLWSRPAMPGESSFDPHVSASLGWMGSDVVKLFTPNWVVPNRLTGELIHLEAGRTYDRWGLHVFTQCNGDFSAAASELRKAEDALLGDLDFEPEVQVLDEVLVDRYQPVDWTTFWDTERKAEDWVVWPIVPAGRQVSLYAGAKQGKSTIILQGLLDAAQGKKPFGSHEAQDPISIVYLDFEMTEEDLDERLDEMGIRQENAEQLSNLHYYLLPSLPPLETPEGGQAVLKLATKHKARLVVVDTYGRAVVGDENDADTTRGFFRNTGTPLKAAKIALLRTDHSGKDQTKGARGSSAKADDVDVVWKLTRQSTGEGVDLVSTHKRMSWVPERVTIDRHEDLEDGTITYRARAREWTAGVLEVVRKLDSLGASEDITVRQAQDLLRGNHAGTRKATVGEALLYRKSDPMRSMESV